MSLQFALYTCDSNTRKTCKSKKEILKFLGDKWLVLLYDKIEFVTDGFKERTFKRTTKQEWIPLDMTR
jgi:hypothetical protein